LNIALTICSEKPLRTIASPVDVFFPFYFMARTVEDDTFVMDLGTILVDEGAIDDVSPERVVTRDYRIMVRPVITWDIIHGRVDCDGERSTPSRPITLNTSC
jgi:hypothetical protein